MSILRADSIRDRAGTGAPDFPHGLTSGTTLVATATTATGLSGTPNITVGTVGCGNVTSTGDVTGVNATFSGNLTVQGTTTTIDTAVTAVDSLNVEGSVGIGTDNPGTKLDVRGGNWANGDIVVGQSGNAGRVKFRRGADGSDSGSIGFSAADNNSVLSMNVASGDGTLTFQTNSTERLRITSTGTAIFKAGLAEKFNNVGSNLASGTHAIQSGNIIRFTGNEAGTNSLNITGIHSTLANGEALSFTVIISPNGSGVINAINIDGVAPATAIQWSGGSVPSAGASGRDVYTFTVLKTGTATNAYEIYGAATNYA